MVSLKSTVSWGTTPMWARNDACFTWWVGVQGGEAQPFPTPPVPSQPHSAHTWEMSCLSMRMQPPRTS